MLVLEASDLSECWGPPYRKKFWFVGLDASWSPFVMSPDRDDTHEGAAVVWVLCLVGTKQNAHDHVLCFH